MVKKGAVAVLGILVFCSLYLALFRSHLGLGILLLPVLLVVFVLLHLSSEISELRERVEILEKKLTCTEVTSEDPVPTAEIREADAGKLERLYRNYPDEKLRKILESKEYREDAKNLAQQILKERAEMSDGE